MFTIAYLKSSKKIVYARHDVGSQVAFDFYFNQHCENNNLNVNDYVCIEHTYDKKLNVVLGNHIFNEATQQIEADPSYVELAQQLDTPS
jgi:hypothetical protein